MRSIFLAFVFFAMIVMVFRGPFLGPAVYMWVELDRPHSLSYTFLSGMPISFITAVLAVVAAAFTGYIKVPKEKLILSLLLIWMLWFTITTFGWAEFPELAFGKWDQSIKTVGFSLFMAFVVRSRLHIEGFITIYVLTIALWTISAGIKTLAGGGGYGSSAMIFIDKTPISPGGILSAVSVLTIPFILWLKKHMTLIPKSIYRSTFFNALIVSHVLTVIGTTQRNGVVCLVALIFFIIMFQKNRVRNIFIFMIFIVIGSFFVPEEWTQRMDTIQNYEEDSSAMHRIQIWLWTLDYVEKHPLGGGFKLQLGHPDVRIEAHSIYFEVLGEHGYPGLIIFLLLNFVAILKLRQIRLNTVRTEETEWIRDLATAILMVILVFLVGGTFVHIAFLFVLYANLALTIVLVSYQRNELSAASDTEGLRRHRATALR